MKRAIMPGDRYAVDGHVVVIAGVHSLHVVEVRYEATGGVATVPRYKLEPLADVGRSSDPTVITDDEWKRALGLFKALSPYNETSALPRDVARAISAQFGISTRHVQRLRARLIREPVVSAMARQGGGRPVGCMTLPKTTERVIAHCIQKHYARREPISVALLALRIQSLCRRLGIRKPSAKAVLSRVKHEEGLSLDIRRLGVKAAKQIGEPRVGRLRITQALAMVQIDHTLVDLMVLSPDRSEVLGRPWLSVAFDIATRSVVGIYLSMDAPSSVSVALCIEHAVLPKRENERDRELWPMHGLMEKLHHDNGKDLRNQGLKRGCEEHGINLVWRPVRTPHYGGHIERQMGTLMQLIHGLPGTTFSNTRQRGNYPSDARATMTLSEARDWLVDAICRLYHARPHRGLGGIPPLIAWERAWRAPDGQLVSPPLPARISEFKMDFLPVARRCLQRTGIEFNRSRYWHPSLAEFIRPGREVIFRYDPRDPMCIWVDTGRPDFVVARAIAGKAIGEHAVLRIDQDTQNSLNDRIDVGFACRDAIEENAAALTRSRRRQPSAKNESYVANIRGKRGGRKRGSTTTPSTVRAAPLMAPSGRPLIVEDLDQ